MKVQPAAFLRTTLPLDLSNLPVQDSGRYHSIWLPDHMVSFWPDSIWTPEFTDLATALPSPHRHLDALAVAGAVAVQTKNVPIATSVVDTVRRHPVMLAQTALTLDHLSKGRFILGVGSGETENTVPYGFEFAKSVSRFEEALNVIKLLWESDGPGAWTPEEYAAKLKTIRDSAERAGRDPMAIVPASIQTCLIAYDDAELAEILNAPLIKAWVMQPSAEALQKFGFEHPLGDGWRGYQDINPEVLPRERILDMLKKTNVEAIRRIIPCGTPKEVARRIKGFVDTGMRVVKIMDYGGMAGLKFAARSAEKVRAAEDELMRLVEEE